MDEDKNSSNLPPVDNTGDPVVPENRQALFTPQPPEPTMTASNTDAPSQSSVNLSHPYLSNRPTQTFNTDTGDIILNTGSPKPKQNKRPFIIGGIAVMLFIVICLTILAVIANKSKQQLLSPTESAKAFNRYANYILYGENSDSNINGNYNRWNAYEFNRQLGQNNDNYWETALSMLDKSVMLYPKDSESTVLLNLQNYQRNFYFFITYRNLEEPTADSIFNAYYTSGKNVAEEYVKSFYADQLPPTSSSAQAYVDAKLAQYQALIEYLTQYHDAGCLSSVGVDLLCVNINTQQILELQEKMNAEAYEAELVIQDLERTIVSDCWQISNQFQALIKNEE